jgi:hypothetical protein
VDITRTHTQQIGQNIPVYPPDLITRFTALLFADYYIHCRACSKVTGKIDRERGGLGEDNRRGGPVEERSEAAYYRKESQAAQWSGGGQVAQRK